MKALDSLSLGDVEQQANEKQQDAWAQPTLTQPATSRIRFNWRRGIAGVLVYLLSLLVFFPDVFRLGTEVDHSALWAFRLASSRSDDLASDVEKTERLFLYV